MWRRGGRAEAEREREEGVESGGGIPEHDAGSVPVSAEEEMERGVE